MYHRRQQSTATLLAACGLLAVWLTLITLCTAIVCRPITMTSHFAYHYHHNGESIFATVNFNLLALLAIQQRLGRRQQQLGVVVTPSPWQPVRNLTAGSSNNSSSKSSGPSATNPDNLPHLPVPALGDTLQKYLLSVKPMLSSEAFERTVKAVNEFSAPGGDGTQLYELLSKRAASSENWLSDWWLKYAYLGYRSPVVIHSNPGLYYDWKRFAGADAWLSHAARTVWATMRYKEQIDAGQIAPERMGKALLDMQQYGKIFGTCRIPKRDFDGIEYNPRSDYVVVAYRNGFYKLGCYVDDRLLTEAELVGQLQHIVQQGAAGDSPPIGVLTSQDRDALAPAYEHLVKQNGETVRTIQQALFVLCLDRAVATDGGKQAEYNVGSHQLIHGGSAKENSANRWFDKTLQLVVNENGLIGLNYEHSPGEGQPIAVLSDFIISHTQANPDVIKPQPLAQKPTPLRFVVDATLQKHLNDAIQHIDGLAGNLDMHVLDFTKYGKNFIKSQKMSPDSYLQMAMQYAYYKKHGCPGPHYESAHHRLFIHGRTETIRSCSIESVAFAQAMCSSGTGVSDAERVRLLHAAVKSHKDYTVMAMTGKGVDRLLLGLKLTALEGGRSVPALYSDESFKRSTHYVLSTSQVASRYKAFMCYGPAVEDGYGICYNPRNDDMLFAVSAFRSCPDTGAQSMAAALSEALDDMYELLVRAGEKPASKL